MQERKSNTINGALRGLAACNAITQEEHESYVRRLTVGDKKNAYGELVARFGLRETDNSRFAFEVPTMRGKKN